MNKEFKQSILDALCEIELLVEKIRISVHDSEEFAKLDISFHLTMAIAAKNEGLNQILSSVREQTMELITKSVLLEEGRGNALRCHIKILEAVRQHNSLKCARHCEITAVLPARLQSSLRTTPIERTGLSCFRTSFLDSRK